MDLVTGAVAWHINADEPDLIDCDMTFKKDAQDLLYAPDAYRSSDHEPAVVYLNTLYRTCLPFVVKAAPGR